MVRLKNIGPKSAAWLNQAGINTLSDLEIVGPAEAYRRVEALGYRPSLNLLYAMHAAILDINWTELPPEMRQSLRQQLEELA